jgi:hypothetical protein
MFRLSFLSFALILLDVAEFGAAQSVGTISVFYATGLRNPQGVAIDPTGTYALIVSNEPSVLFRLIMIAICSARPIHTIIAFFGSKFPPA